MKKMYINYIFNTCTEIFETKEEAVANALKENHDGDYIYLNHYVDKEHGLDGWHSYIAPDGDMDGTRYISKAEYDDGGWTGYWDDEWDAEEEITVENV